MAPRKRDTRAFTNKDKTGTENSSGVIAKPERTMGTTPQTPNTMGAATH